MGGDPDLLNLSLKTANSFNFVMKIDFIEYRPDERGGAVVPELEPQIRPRARPSPPGLIFDLIFTLYSIICVSNNTIFAFKNLKPA